MAQRRRSRAGLAAGRAARRTLRLARRLVVPRLLDDADGKLRAPQDLLGNAAQQQAPQPGTPVAALTNVMIAIYPITPSSPDGRAGRQWSARAVPNIWGTCRTVVEMQSEAGAAAPARRAAGRCADHDLHRVAGPAADDPQHVQDRRRAHADFVMHVAARTVATHALSIFGDHSDVMACRQTGLRHAGLGSVQEAHDIALISQAATLAAAVPFLHFFDGFRTSHEVSQDRRAERRRPRALIDRRRRIRAHRDRAHAGRPGAARHGAEPRRLLPGARGVQPVLRPPAPHRRQARWTLRRARPAGSTSSSTTSAHPEAERVIVLMGSGAETPTRPSSTWPPGREGRRDQGAPVPAVRRARASGGAAQDRSSASPCSTAPRSPGATASRSTRTSSPPWRSAADGDSPPRRRDAARDRRAATACRRKEFTPAMVKAVFDELAKDEPKNHFTVGINDDVTHLSSTGTTSWDLDAAGHVSRRVLRPRGRRHRRRQQELDQDHRRGDRVHAQGYFVYDSKKSGAITVSHLRFGPKPIRSHLPDAQGELRRLPPVGPSSRSTTCSRTPPGATFLLNSPHSPTSSGTRCPSEMQEGIIEKNLKLYTIDAYEVARETGMGVRINTIMQTCFFAISGVLPRDEAIAKIKEAIQKTYGKKGERSRAPQLRRGRRHAGPSARGRSARARATRRTMRPPIVSDARRTSSRTSPR
jgi:pyruvate-ferredoxin/flavodoxin oxidoreductase